MAQTKAQLLGPVIGDVTIDVSTLSLDSVSNKVGIGTDNPQEKLHVDTGTVLVTNTTAPQIRISADNTDASDNDRTILGQATANSHFVDNAVDNDTVLRGTSTGNILFGIGTSEKLRITSDGKIGIGSDDPRYALDLHGGNLLVSGSAAGNLILEDRSVADGSRPFAVLASNDGNFTITNSNRNASKTTTGSTERLCILSTGRIGIGTDTTTAKLEITDAIGTTGEEVLLKLQGRATKNVYLDINADANRRGVIRFKSAGTDKWSIGRGDSDELSDSSFFIATGSSGGNTAKLVINSDGKVGINNSAPLYAMHFKNAMGSSPSFIHMETTGTNTVGGGGGIAFDTSASNALSNNGLYLATISGVRTNDDDGSNDLVFKTSRAGAPGDDGNDHSPKERLRIDSSGRILIGTNSSLNQYASQSHLQVAGTGYDSSTIAIRREQNNANPPGIVFAKSRSGTLGGNTIVQDNDQIGSLIFTAADGTDLTTVGAQIKVEIDGTPASNNIPGRIVFQTGGAAASNERLRITSGGNVGIGTDNPAEKLEVYGNGRFKATDGSHGIELYPDVGGLGYQRIISFNRTSSAYENLSIGVNDFIVTNGSSTEALHITSAGNVGIGTNNPESKVHIRGGANSQIIFETLTTANAASGGPVICLGESTTEVGVSGGIAFVEGITSSGNNYNVTMGLYYNGINNIFAITGSSQAGALSASVGDSLRAAVHHFVVLRDSGRIGIGISGPSAGDLTTGASLSAPKLHILDDNSQTGAYKFVTRFESGADADNTGATIVVNHSNDRGLAIQGGRGSINKSFGAIKSIDNSGRLSNVMAFSGASGKGVDYIALYTGDSLNTSPRLHIDSGGNVGIGTEDPTARLEVKGNGDFSGTFHKYEYGDGAGILVKGNESTVDVIASNAGSLGASLILRNGTKGFVLTTAPDEDDLHIRSFTSTGNDFTFHGAGSNVTSLNKIVTFAKAGNVGIGTDNPSAKLHVNGDLKTNDLILSNLDNPTGGNEVDGTRGHWCIQEGKNNLYLINKLTGDKFMFNITKVN